MDREIFQENLKHIREEAGLTQKELSEKSNYDRTYVGKIERGDKDPSIEAVIRLANTLDVPVLEFFEEERPDEAESIANQLKNSPERAADTYRQAFSEASQMMALLNDDGEFIDANPALRDYNGLDLDDIVGEALTILPMWSDDDTSPEWLEPMIDKALKGESVVRKTHIYDTENNDLTARVYLATFTTDSRNQTLLLLEVNLIDEIVDRTMVLQ